MVSNPLDPDLMTAPERLSEVASLLARGILRHCLRTADSSAVALAKADGRKPALSGVEGKVLDVLREPRDECVETRSEAETHESVGQNLAFCPDH